MRKIVLILAFIALLLPSAFAVPGQNMELIESYCGITECKALLQIKTPGQIMITRSPQFKFEFLSEKGSIASYTTRLGKQTKIEEPTYKEYCHKELIEDENKPMAFVQTDVCEWVQDWNKTTFRTQVEWENDIFGKRIDRDTNYFIELTGKKTKTDYIGEFKVDWVMTFNGHTYSEWAWWNASWGNRKQVYIPNNVDLNKGDTVTVQVDFTAITIRSDFYDLRMYDANTDVEIGRAIEGDATDTAGYVGFFLNHGITAGQTDVNYYYLYSNNAGASAPTDANAALTKVCNADAVGNACQFAAPVTRGTGTIIYGIASLEGTGAGRTRATPTLGAYNDFNYTITVRTEDDTKITGMSIAYGASNACSNYIRDGSLGYSAGGFQAVIDASNNTTYKLSIHYVDGTSGAGACKYVWADEDDIALAAGESVLQEGAGGTITGIVIYLNDGGGDDAFADNVYIGLPAFSPGLAAAEAPNAAPYMTSIDLNAALAKENDHIKVVVAGTGDAESEALTLLCGTASNPTVDTNNFCTSFSIPFPYTTVECTGNGAAGDGLQTIYCRLFDLVNYSSEKSDTYTADNTAPVVGAMIFEGFILSYTGGFIDGSGTFFATADANYCEYSLDDSAWTSGTYDGTYCVSPTIVINDKTIYAFNQRAFDGVGNSGTGTAVNYTGKGVLVDPENIEDAELINVSWGLVYNTFVGIAFAIGTIILIILSMIVIKAFFN